MRLLTECAGSRELTHDQRLVAVAAEPEPEPEPSHPAAGPSVSGSEHHLSASEMFAAAARARVAGDAAEAIRVSKQIEEFFPNSDEGINTHLALGVLYLQQNLAELALQEFANFRRLGSPEAKAEAYFGRAAGAKAARTLDGGHGIRIDLDERGGLIGLEITAPSVVTIGELNSVLAQYGVAALKDEEWAPLAA